MVVNNDKKLSLISSLIKPANTAPPKDTVFDSKNNGDYPDKVELTSKRLEASRLREKAKTEPVIRRERVLDIRDAIMTQTYNIKGELVARSLLKHHIIDAVL